MLRTLLNSRADNSFDVGDGSLAPRVQSPAPSADARGFQAATPTDGSYGDLSWPLRRACALYGDCVAVVDGDRTVTYRELGIRIGRLPARLDTLGASLGARIAFLGANSLAHLECSIGVPMAGRVLVDLNHRLAASELEFIAADCGVGVLITDQARLPVARALKERLTGLSHLVFVGPGSCPEDCVPYERLVDDGSPEQPRIDGCTLAMISYTGGTTGAPKGVMLSHGNLLANARHNLLATGHTRDDRWLHMCPMFHVAGTANIFACTWVGARQVVLPEFEASNVIDTVIREEVTHTVLVPTMLTMLLDELESRGCAGLPSLRHLQYAASPISAPLQRRLLETFDCDIAQFYGMTEAAPTVSHLTPDDHRRGLAGQEPQASRLAGVGAPVVGVEAQVRALDRSEVEIGGVGEIWVRGPNVMLGYWNRPEETKAALVDGWYRTGDVARADHDGYLYLVDRMKDMIISGGENVYSIEVERALLAHPDVLEAAVFGIPDSRWGEAVHAVVVARPGHAADLDALLAHCRGVIAGYKVPKSVEVWNTPLPKSGAGKVLKHALREPFWSNHVRRIS